VPIRRAHHCGRVREFFEDSLKALGLDYVDLVSRHGTHRRLRLISRRGSTLFIPPLRGLIMVNEHVPSFPPPAERSVLPRGRREPLARTLGRRRVPPFRRDFQRDLGEDGGAVGNRQS